MHASASAPQRSWDSQVNKETAALSGRLRANRARDVERKFEDLRCYLLDLLVRAALPDTDVVGELQRRATLAAHLNSLFPGQQSGQDL
jgi:hypothetical protein